MLKRFLVTVMALAGANAALAQSLNSALVTDQANGWAAIDFQVVLANANDSWLAHQVFGSSPGGLFRTLGTPANPGNNDPNAGPIVPPSGYHIAPDRDGNPLTADESFRTFVSRPALNQLAAARFRLPSAPENLLNDLPGAANATTIDGIGGLDFPPDAINDGGWIARVAINVPAEIDFADLYIAGAANPGDEVLASGVVAWGTLSTVTSVQTPWVIAAVPEPTSLALLALGSLMGLRRR